LRSACPRQSLSHIAISINMLVGNVMRGETRIQSPTAWAALSRTRAAPHAKLPVNARSRKFIKQLDRAEFTHPQQHAAHRPDAFHLQPTRTFSRPTHVCQDAASRRSQLMPCLPSIPLLPCLAAAPQAGPIPLEALRIPKSRISIQSRSPNFQILAISANSSSSSCAAPRGPFCFSRQLVIALRSLSEDFSTNSVRCSGASRNIHWPFSSPSSITSQRRRRSKVLPSKLW